MFIGAFTTYRHRYLTSLKKKKKMLQGALKEFCAVGETRVGCSKAVIPAPYFKPLHNDNALERFKCSVVENADRLEADGFAVIELCTNHDSPEI